MGLPHDPFLLSSPAHPALPDDESNIHPAFRTRQPQTPHTPSSQYTTQSYTFPASAMSNTASSKTLATDEDFEQDEAEPATEQAKQQMTHDNMLEDEEGSDDEEEEEDSDLDDDSDGEDSDLEDADLKGFVDELIKARKLQTPSAHQLYKYAQATYSQLPTERKRNIAMMAILLSTAEIVAANESTKISEEGNQQMKSYVGSVLLSPSVAAYIGNPVFKPTLELLKTNATKLPKNWISEPVTSVMVRRALRTALTQARSEMKKKLLKSREDTWDIAALALSLCGDKVIITAAHWARFAFL
ncbi:hypothetical protein M422DRAFT_778272 [Sphaerobolus stellatus SS14]|uniref:Uncharacterized protein n=1 Tax=Sphaerobolus stellatus (strain SS14) TaxID=990650 RepID=A0A0C9W4H3_SPHS4|nr:hypothetical protein M422DRAFT_778272 [Sphaerobolus stellatus SS14]